MSKLISGKDALIALVNGEDVEGRLIGVGPWSSYNTNTLVRNFLDNDFEFRLKPQTIAINGIEVPAPFEPKEGDECWHLWPKSEIGYGFIFYSDGDSHHCQFGAWRTEEEIKQVVAALRQVFGGSHE